jgi:hypothetical protein
VKVSGGCACGALRYEAATRPLETGFCHCRLCQKTTGAPVLVFASFSAADFRYLSCEPRIFESSSHGAREFCPTCGTQIAYRDIENAKTIDVNVGSLDDPSCVRPECHIWYGSKLPWLETGDSLPRYEKSKPPHSEN